MYRALFLSTALAITSATSSWAGNTAPPRIEPEVIVADTSSSAGDILVPILALIFFAAALSGGSGGAGAAASDARLKRDITPTGDSAGGLPLYTYRYIGGTTRWEGVMAQDVLETRADAVIQGPFGYMAVDYEMLGLEMRRVD